VRPRASDDLHAAGVRRRPGQGREILGASVLVIAAGPAEVAIRVYRSRGFADLRRRLSLERPAA
jgi:hypothetical protein